MVEMEYKKVGDYFLPDLEMPDTKVTLGKYGMMRRTYLKERRPLLYSGLKMKFQILEHLEQVDNEANEMLECLINQMKKAQGVTEELKATDQLKWVKMMNNIRNAAEEIVLREIVYD